MKKYETIIGIDPDVEKSGVSTLEVATHKLEVAALTFPQLLDYLQFVKRQEILEVAPKAIVVVEAGWLNQSNWHLNRNDNARTASAKGNATGRNHEVGRKIVEMAKHYGLEVVEQPPLKKYWKGKDGKITHEELAYFTGLTGRTSQEMRDSALLAWVYANLPIKIKA